MACAIWTSFHLQKLNIEDSSKYIKQLYIKNKNWHPEPAPLLIEDKITQFEKQLKARHKHLTATLNKRNLRNLTYSQSATLRLLKTDKNITIKPTDKNLGPAIMETKDYIQQVLKEHLLTKDYERVPEAVAKNQMDDIKQKLKSLITENQALISKAELTYFQRSFKCPHRTPIFYGLPKVHKVPMSLRPVVSTSSSFLSVFSVWLDFKMKELLPLVQSYIQNSSKVVDDLKLLNIPDGALLFSTDAKSMYTNIDTNTGVSALQDLITSNNAKLSANFPTVLFLHVLATVMDNNIFTFAGTYWKQQSGTTMGTPAACNYATISYGNHENTKILPRFKSNLLYYKHYIDDIFAIWLPPDKDKISTWNDFKKELNNWGHLKWVIEDPSSKTTFLDLNLNLNGSSVTTSTFQKELNLYLYIPPASSHPPSCLKGLIAGKLRRYYKQNNAENFQNMLGKFISRLLDRGHNIKDITPLL
jgi:hypothetical protein